MTACARPPAETSITEAAQAAAEAAIAAAGVDLPMLPGDCYIDTPHAPRPYGEELATILRAERRQLDTANAKRFDCAKVYNDIRAGFAAGIYD